MRAREAISKATTRSQAGGPVRLRHAGRRGRATGTALAAGLALLLSTGAVAYAQDEEGTADSAYDQQKKDEELRKMRLENDKLEREEREAGRKELLEAIPDAKTDGKIDVKDGAGQIEANALSAVALNALAARIAADTAAAAGRSRADPALRDAADPCRYGIEADALTHFDAPAKDGGFIIADDGSALEEAADAASGARPPAPEPAPPPAPAILLLPGSEALSFSQWESFRFRHCTIENAFNRAIEDAGELGGAGAAPRDKSLQYKSFSLDAGLSTAIGATAKLLQLVTPDWEVGGLTVTKTEKALMAAVARDYVADGGRIYWAGQVSKSGGSNEVFGKLAALDRLDIAATRQLARLEPALASAQKAGKKASRAQKAALDSHPPVIAALKAARTAYAQLMTHLNGKEGEAILPINQVVNQSALDRLLGTDGLVLNVSVGSAGGGYYTRKVIWNALGLGGPPFKVSGGAEVHFIVVRPADQRVFGGGNFPCLADYVRINRVARRTNRADAADGLACR